MWAAGRRGVTHHALVHYNIYTASRGQCTVAPRVCSLFPHSCDKLIQLKAVQFVVLSTGFIVNKFTVRNK